MDKSRSVNYFRSLNALSDIEFNKLYNEYPYRQFYNIISGFYDLDRDISDFYSKTQYVYADNERLVTIKARLTELHKKTYKTSKECNRIKTLQALVHALEGKSGLSFNIVERIIKLIHQLIEILIVFKSLERIEKRLRTPREKLIFIELIRRYPKYDDNFFNKERFYYTVKCIKYLIEQNLIEKDSVITLNEDLIIHPSLTDDEIIKKAHIHRFLALKRCDTCKHYTVTFNDNYISNGKYECTNLSDSTDRAFYYRYIQADVLKYPNKTFCERKPSTFHLYLKTLQFSVDFNYDICICHCLTSYY